MNSSTHDGYPELRCPELNTTSTTDVGDPLAHRVLKLHMEVIRESNNFRQTLMEPFADSTKMSLHTMGLVSPTSTSSFPPPPPPPLPTTTTAAAAGNPARRRCCQQPAGRRT
eukprot:CAMPEP_0177572338 /NCGR_PEP_ID=MMETSP0369-20130122/77903_1 /TAXON_ID=447022 ORGANISM="Scrippsiella hangoei-like, Strain SHHI-4" /NCGR_SAMPLE_ID=MMETSP0369 /ASSEMBLY_ACC=CAM_ASM_000364 /LENGTH=111 /DNA_ID=CAMNT_0019060301 /DNA_START=181 /DNA_END=513 /DNA_ORIENTATION=-